MVVSMILIILRKEMMSHNKCNKIKCITFKLVVILLKLKLNYLKYVLQNYYGYLLLLAVRCQSSY